MKATRSLDVIRWNPVLRTAIATLCLTKLFACSTQEEKEQGPAPLPEFKAERDFDKMWSHGIGNGQGELYNRLTPAVHGSKIIAAAANGDVEAYDRLTGRSLWDADIDRPISGGVGIGCGLAFVASEDGGVWALSEETGKTQWHIQLNAQVLAPPVCESDVVAVLTFSGDLFGLSAANGEKKWSYNGTAPVLSLRASAAPLLHNGAVIAGLGTGKVIALQLENGTQLWEARVGVSQGSSEIERQIDVGGDMLIDDDTLYVASFQGRLAAIDLRSGRRSWDAAASSYVGLSEGYGNVYLTGAAGSVTAFSKNNQGVRWEQTALARRQLSGSAVLDNYVVVGDIEGYLHLLSQIDGHFAARMRVDSDGIRVAPIVVDDVMYVYGNSGTLAAYQLEK